MAPSNPIVVLRNDTQGYSAQYCDPTAEHVKRGKWRIWCRAKRQSESDRKAEWDGLVRCEILRRERDDDRVVRSLEAEEIKRQTRKDKKAAAQEEVDDNALIRLAAMHLS